jgi:hypothetical protein
MFFGHTNSLATFQMMIKTIFRKEITTGNVIIYSIWTISSMLPLKVSNTTVLARAAETLTKEHSLHGKQYY